MNKFNPTKELNKFRNIAPSKWNDMLAQYDRQTLQDFAGLLIVANLHSAETLNNILRINSLDGVINGIK